MLGLDPARAGLVGEAFEPAALQINLALAAVAAAAVGGEPMPAVDALVEQILSSAETGGDPRQIATTEREARLRPPILE